ncbi:uracil-DNA glycosylase [Candidatus Bathyarchaeota archaeon]|nr:uracil-DNA glycosylase [Candidatus Bathyarchaeota archaeon]MBT4320946.1 uracil-DNA glycosylase [Candidatus Bathyarchaeota archaeon]MBT4424731.1 uracil-DNA glycosylase [Candidatus Bathyarchaeota archaeon]MBT5643467.1 uracil-DNA glycosylase [Candidatus Bathyarchaeota archaeon]MBT6604316.1 uracil-DNA glycosylase [Candidatus Bathyarchaeota archaeon]
MYRSEDREKTAGMNQITTQVESCANCGLSETRTKVVLGAGTLDAKIVLVGEAPGRKEDESGLPFVGSSGKLLDRLLAAAGLSRDDIFIGNIIKCRPPKNRRPKKSEVGQCEGYMMEQLEIINPAIVAPMGNSSLSYFQERFGLEKQVIGDVHGKVIDIKAPWGRTKLFPLYHPAAAIYRRHLLGELEEDMKKLGELASK